MNNGITSFGIGESSLNTENFQQILDVASYASNLTVVEILERLEQDYPATEYPEGLFTVVNGMGYYIQKVNNVNKWVEFGESKILADVERSINGTPAVRVLLTDPTVEEKATSIVVASVDDIPNDATPGSVYRAIVNENVYYYKITETGKLSIDDEFAQIKDKAAGLSNTVAVINDAYQDADEELSDSIAAVRTRTEELQISIDDVTEVIEINNEQLTGRIENVSAGVKAVSDDLDDVKAQIQHVDVTTDETKLVTLTENTVNQQTTITVNDNALVSKLADIDASLTAHANTLKGLENKVEQTEFDNRTAQLQLAIEDVSTQLESVSVGFDERIKNANASISAIKDVLSNMNISTELSDANVSVLNVSLTSAIGTLSIKVEDNANSIRNLNTSVAVVDTKFTERVNNLSTNVALLGANTNTSLAGIKGEIDVLDSNIDQIEARLSAFEGTDGKLNTTKVALENSINTVKDSVDTLKSTVENNASTVNAELATANATITANKTDVDGKIAGINTAIDNVSNNVDAIKTDVNNRIDDVDSNVSELDDTVNDLSTFTRNAIKNINEHFGTVDAFMADNTLKDFANNVSIALDANIEKVNGLDSRLTELAEVHADNVSVINASIVKSNTSVNTLENEVSGLKTVTDQLETSIDDNKTAIDELSEAVLTKESKLNEKITNLGTVVTENASVVKAKFETVDGNIAGLGEDINAIRDNITSGLIDIKSDYINVTDNTLARSTTAGYTIDATELDDVIDDINTSIVNIKDDIKDLNEVFYGSSDHVTNITSTITNAERKNAIEIASLDRIPVTATAGTIYVIKNDIRDEYYRVEDEGSFGLFQTIGNMQTQIDSLDASRADSVVVAHNSAEYITVTEDEQPEYSTFVINDAALRDKIAELEGKIDDINSSVEVPEEVANAIFGDPDHLKKYRNPDEDVRETAVKYYLVNSSLDIPYNAPKGRVYAINEINDETGNVNYSFIEVGEGTFGVVHGVYFLVNEVEKINSSLHDIKNLNDKIYGTLPEYEILPGFTEEQYETAKTATGYDDIIIYLAQDGDYLRVMNEDGVYDHIVITKAGTPGTVYDINVSIQELHELHNEELEALREDLEEQIDTLSIQHDEDIATVNKTAHNNFVNLNASLQATETSLNGKINTLRSDTSSSIASVNSSLRSLYNDAVSKISNLTDKHNTDVSALTSKINNDISVLRKDHNDDFDKLNLSINSVDDSIRQYIAGLEADVDARFDNTSTRIKNEVNIINNNISTFKANVNTSFNDLADVVDSADASLADAIMSLNAQHIVDKSNLENYIQSVETFKAEVPKTYVTNENIGNIDANTTASVLNGKTIDEMLTAILFADHQPTISEPSVEITYPEDKAVIEFGDSIDVVNIKTTDGYVLPVSKTGVTWEHDKHSYTVWDAPAYYVNGTLTTFPYKPRTHGEYSIVVKQHYSRYNAAWEHMTSQGNDATPIGSVSKTIVSEPIVVKAVKPYFANGVFSETIEDGVIDNIPTNNEQHKIVTSAKQFAVSFPSQSKTHTPWEIYIPVNMHLESAIMQNPLNGKWDNKIPCGFVEGSANGGQDTIIVSVKYDAGVATYKVYRYNDPVAGSGKVLFTIE